MNRYNKKSNRKYNNKDYKKNNRRRDEPQPSKLRGLVVTPFDGESADHMIKRFKRIVEGSGLMRELKKREFYLSTSQKRREKKKQALKRQRRRARGLGEDA